MVLTRSMVRTIKYNENEIKEFNLWIDELKLENPSRCNENCEKRNMIGRSWWKCNGYSSPCICAVKSEIERCNNEIMICKKIINLYK